MKFCKKCQCEKSLLDFYKNKSAKNGIRTVCKSCDDKRKAKYIEKNLNLVAKTKKEWKIKNKEKVQQYLFWWRKEYSHKMCAYASKRRALLIGATPKWADKGKIEAIYRQAALMNKMNPKIKYQVDHIIPLNNKLVCGLHTHENMQIIPASQNLLKRNFFQIEGVF